MLYLRPFSPRTFWVLVAMMMISVLVGVTLTCNTSLITILWQRFKSLNHLNTGVTILGELPGQELVELSLEDSILDKLPLL